MGGANFHRVMWSEVKGRGWRTGKPLMSYTCLFGFSQDHEKMGCEGRHVGGMRTSPLGTSMPFGGTPTKAITMN